MFGPPSTNMFLLRKSAMLLKVLVLALGCIFLHQQSMAQLSFSAIDSALTVMENRPALLRQPDSNHYSATMMEPTFKVQKQKQRLSTQKKINIMAGAQISTYAIGMAGLYAAWYKDYPQSAFHSFNDNAEWKGMDKIGHAYSAYAESKASMELWRWTGIERKKRIWIGGLSGAMYQTVIEVLDGFSAEWGWSWGDFGANLAGSGMLIAQELAWDEQRIQFKWSFHKRNYGNAGLNKRSEDIFGKGAAERFLKDYNAQTYWLSTTIKPFFPNSNLPAWLQVSVGTGVEGLFGARSNIAVNQNQVTTFYRPDIKRYRQWYLAPDVDLSKIKTKKRGVRIALNILNIVKFPTPSLEYSNGSFKMNWFHF